MEHKEAFVLVLQSFPNFSFSVLRYSSKEAELTEEADILNYMFARCGDTGRYTAEVHRDNDRSWIE